MKILIWSKETKFFILLPTSLLFNRLSAMIAAKVIKAKQPAIDLSVEDCMRLIAFIKEYKRRHRYWEVVNIHTADGETIYISL